MPQSLLFDAVIFDLDGTLVATDRFWVDAARAGARRAFAELGLEREMPSAEQWMSMVGLPLATGFELVFPELTRAQRQLVLERCVEEEENALRAGQAALLPGVRETLDALRARGVQLGVASNCGQGYLDTMLHELGLAEWIVQARCLDSPRMRNKASMVRDLLETFRTRSAVVVGDRSGDRDAAWENGLPHVHYARGFAAADERIEAEAALDDMGLLVPLLERRGQRIETALAQLGCLGPNAPRSLAVTGHLGSGRALVARDLSRLLAEAGKQSAIVPFDAFLRPDSGEQDLTRTAFVSAEHALEYVSASYDIEALVRHVLAPSARGERVVLERGGSSYVLPAGATLIVQGPYLAHPALRPHFERLVHLEVDETVALRRISGRDGWTQGPESVLQVRKHALPAQRAFDERCPPREHADLVLETSAALLDGDPEVSQT